MSISSTVETYIEKTGIIATDGEMALMLAAAAKATTIPSAELIILVHNFALRHGLPKLSAGHYGVDLTTGEFLRTVIAG